MRSRALSLLSAATCVLIASACTTIHESGGPSSAGDGGGDAGPALSPAGEGGVDGGHALNPPNTYVQLFKWRWPDIATECGTFLGPNGFGGVEISPPMESIATDDWWDMYQPVNYKVLVSDMGNAAELQEMITKCHAAGVRIYVDAVLNHQATGTGIGTGGSSYDENTYTYPLFGPDNFHANCAIQASDYNDDRSNVVNCRLEGLPDLATDTAPVRSTLAAYLSALVAMGVDGFRLDSAKHMWQQDIQAYLGQVPTTTLLGEPLAVTQEIIPDGTVVRSDYFEDGTVNEFNFTYTIRDAFRGNNGEDISQLPALTGTGDGGGSAMLLPSANATVFVDNHDTERSQTDSLNLYQDGKSFDLAMIYMLGAPYGSRAQLQSGFLFTFANTDVNAPTASPYDANGNPLIMVAWDFVHRWPDIYPMVAFRNATAGQPMTNINTSTPGAVAFSRGAVGFVALNNGASPWQASLMTGLPAGTYCDIVHGSLAADASSCAGDSIVVDATGTAALDIPAISPPETDASTGGSVVPAVVLYTGQRIAD
jgi:alpha-amylase